MSEKEMAVRQKSGINIPSANSPIEQNDLLAKILTHPEYRKEDITKNIRQILPLIKVCKYVSQVLS
uniref:Uncharacterized protein n=1 Tax=Rhizophagus irregularis (strain DAOM 181602 / DAOM 197198 / MUCL 43194) TaxID=747089 RepID=U9UX39_RHIID